MSAMISLFLFLCFVLWVWKLCAKSNKKTEAPAAGGAWPVLGHLNLLGGPTPAHITLGNMADKYGPVFTIKLGMHRALVVSNWKIAKECFTTNDRVFANRPKALAMEILGYNRAMFGFAPYGDYWRQMRKIATLELLSNLRLETFKGVRESEVKVALQELYEIWKTDKSGNSKAQVEMKKWFGEVILNVILRIVVGQRIPSMRSGEDSGRFMRKALQEFFEWSGKFVIADALPFLRWLDIGGDEKAMKKLAKELDQVVEGWLQEHKRRSLSGEAKSGEDFMNVMLSILKDEKEHDADTINKATCLALILAAGDTSAITLTWALSLLLNNPETLKKAKEELDIQVGKKRPVEESDIKNLVYLQAVIKETLRLYPAGPLSVPHESMEDCTISGFHIPAGTWLLPNFHKIHRDPQVWSDPCEFKPERFLTNYKNVDVRGQNFELIPFSSGRRMCPGISFALQIMQLTLAGLLHGFDVATPSDEPVDMSEGAGMTDHKATPLEVLIAPRLPADCYEVN